MRLKVVQFNMQFGQVWHDQDPDHAPSDGPNMIRIEHMEALIGTLRAFDDLAKGR